MRSKISAQGRIHVPVAVRAALGLRPGGALQWVQDGDSFKVSLVKPNTDQQVHAALFPKGHTEAAKSLLQLKQGVAQYVQSRHARR